MVKEHFTALKILTNLFNPQRDYILLDKRLHIDYNFLFKKIQLTESDRDFAIIGPQVYCSVILLPKIFLPSYRTKSQKKRFEEELNERMIQAIDGINAQK